MQKRALGTGLVDTGMRLGTRDGTVQFCSGFQEWLLNAVSISQFLPFLAKVAISVNLVKL